jgi:hypothetical protein
MADQSDITRWLLDAEDIAPGDKPAQIVWLKAQRTTYAEAVKSGDWAIGSSSFEGASSSGTRGISDKANHDAIVGALKKLGATNLGGSGSLLSLRTHALLD